MIDLLLAVAFATWTNAPTSQASGFSFPPRSATLAWDASTSIETIGYRVYWGTNSRSYFDQKDVGGSLITTVSNLTAGTTYYFAVTSYDLAGLESYYSTEASTTTLPAQKVTQVRALQAEALDGAWLENTNWAPITLTNVAANQFYKLSITNWVQ